MKRVSTMAGSKGFLHAAIFVIAVAFQCEVRATTYFVNDGLTNGDVYTTAVGSDLNAGTNANAPMLTLTNLLAVYTLTQGDTVCIDSGYYSNYVVGVAYSGVSTNYIVIKGSTNALGTTFDRRTNNSDVIVLSGNNVRLMNLTLRGGRRGVNFSFNSNCELIQVNAISNSSGFFGAGAVGHHFLRCVAANNSIGFENFNSGVVWDQGISWSNGTAFAQAAASTVSISNSIIVGGTAYGILPSAADYNIYWQTALGGGANNIAELQAANGNSFRSTWVDPGLVNPAAQDYHPTSPAGRYEPASQSFVTTDTTFSAAIDLGDPARTFTNEPSPNGSKMNLGNFGNTLEASASQTSAWLFAQSENDGGEIVVSGNLCWVHGGSFAATSTVTLQYSPDGGGSWSNIVAGIRVTNDVYSWMATSAVSSLRMLWRVRSDSDTNLLDQCNTNFILRATTSTVFSLYVNDASTNGDVYCSAVGSSTNSGLSPNQPLDSAQAALDTYDLGRGDTVLVDSGTYTNPISFSVQDKGDSGGYMTIQGSTNYATPGTLFDIHNAGLDGFKLSGVSYVRLRNLTVRGARYGITISGSDNCSFDFVSSISNLIGVTSASALNNNFQHCVAARNSTGLLANNSGWVWEHGISWFNNVAFDVTATAIAISNSVVVGGVAFASGVTPNKSDYNVFWQTSLGGSYATLNELQELTGHDWHSTAADPQLVDGSGLEFHERSQAGRYNPATGTFVSDTNTSILVDTGDPSHTFASEPAPNGGRLNGGLYGDTSQASKSRTNAWLLALTYNDGGTLSAPGDIIYWTGGNLSNYTVRIELSTDSGASWQIVQTNLVATNGSYTWANTNFSSSLFARWRVVLESNTNVYDATDANSVFRSGPFIYYINDTNTLGDVYTTVIGNDTNLGTSASTPKSTLAALLAAYDIDPGDIIYIDTGHYLLSANQTVTLSDSGNATSRVTIIGSTNTAFGGTDFDRGDTNAASYGIYLNGAQYLDLRDISVRNAGTGVRVESSTSIGLTRVMVKNSQIGYHFKSSSDVSMDHSAAALSGAYGAYVENTDIVRMNYDALWMNGTAGIRVDLGLASVSNSIVAASGVSAYCYSAAGTNNIVGDYNALFARDDAVIGTIDSLARNVDSLGAWTALAGSDVNSLEGDPLIASEAALDFHLQTATPNGRFIPTYGFVLSDPDTSPLIDAGYPGAAFTNEPSPNGGRVDIGLYGNSAEASKGRTNAFLVAASLRDGGWTRGTSALHWVSYAFTNLATVNVDVSLDGGVTWSIVSSNTPATNQSVLWNTLATGATPAAFWRVTSTSNTNIFDRTTNFFATRNSNLVYYVNDFSTGFDQYATAVGASSNWVASAARPMSSLQAIFTNYDIEPGDRVLVDAGTYSNSTITVGRKDEGSANAPVVVLGVSNEVNSTVLDRHSSIAGAYGMAFNSTRWLAVSNIVVRDGYFGVLVTNSSSLNLSLWAVSNAQDGFVVRQSSGINLQHSVAAFNLGNGIVADNSSAMSVLQSVIWSNGGSAVSLTTATVSVSNSVLAASGVGNYAYKLVSGSDVIHADYNCIFLGDSAQVGVAGTTPYKQLYRWQSLLSNDLWSLAYDPQLSDPVGLDFHERSQAGRFTTAGTVSTDAVNSVLIDTADPSASFASETAPNGIRMNVGLYGNTTSASRSRTNGWVLILTLNDGGAFRGTNVLRWATGGSATDDVVFVDYSADGGATWTNIATNIQATAGSVVWTSSAYASSTLGKWRVVSYSDTNATDVSDSFFSLVNGGLNYYVNDGSTVGDVFCTAVGSSTNDGLSASTPNSAVQSIISRYDLRDGDQILVDTGVYGITNTIRINENIVGNPTNRFVIRGSTNYNGGGTVLRQDVGSPMLEITSTHDIGIKDLTISGAVVGVRILTATNCLVQNMRVFNPTLGFDLDRADGNILSGCAAYNIRGTGLLQRAGTSNLWVDGALAGVNASATCVRVDNGSLVVSNSVLIADGRFSTAYSIGLTVQFAADYNDVLVTNNANAALISGALYDGLVPSVSRWARDTGNDRHSLSHDPSFFNPAAGDYHAYSDGGRYNPSSNAFVTDVLSSVLIDAGDPAGTFTNELSPNGLRRNIGPYANSREASKTSTNQFATVVSLNDGGRAEGTNVLLYWVARGGATGTALRLEYSSDGGTSWVVIASNVNGSAGQYAWNSLSYTSSIRSFWRMVNQSNSTEQDRNDQPFALRNQPLVFYVNDTSTVGDVYCLAVGSSTNSGLKAQEPLSSLQEVLDRYDLEGGDSVFIDTGIYTGSQSYVIGQLDSGDASNRLMVIGSTNEAAGGTVLSQFGVIIKESQGVELRNLSIRPSLFASADDGVNVSISTNVLLRNVRVRGGDDGVQFDRCTDVFLDGCSFTGARSNGVLSASSIRLQIQNAVIWSNTYGVRAIGSGSCTLSNSVVGGFASNTFALTIAGSSFSSDYNDYFLGGGVLLASEQATPISASYDSVSKWTYDTGRDTHSLSHDPLFADSTVGDYHLKSQQGRYNPLTGLFVQDPVTSPLIDAGDPAAAFAFEPAPNGSRRNIGMFGNTLFASMTSTNGALTVLSLNDGGKAVGTNVTLRWLAQGATTGHLVRIEVSYNAGANWHVVTSNLTASSGTYVWNSTVESNSMLALWRVIDQSNTNVMDSADRTFAIRNAPFAFYVNDLVTAGDIYSSAAGSSGNDGLAAASPKLSVQEVLDTYDLEGGDTIFVDTGTYATPSPIAFGQLDSAESTNAPRVLVQGSTNMAAGGTILDRQGGTYGIVASSAIGMHFRNLIIRNAGTGLLLSQSYDSLVEWLMVEGGTRAYDVLFANNCKFRHCSARATSQAGLNSLGAANTLWENGVLWSNGLRAIALDGGSMQVSNSILGAFGSNTYAYDIQSGVLQADYNDIFLTNGASASRRVALPDDLIYQTVSRWARDATQDVHSLSHDPIFVSADAGDFHVRSQGGHYVTATGLFVPDGVSSPVLDAGAPMATYTNEPDPNGTRVNMGAFSDSAQASLTPTNPSFTAVTVNDGGRAEGTNWMLYWVAHGAATGHAVRLDYSPDAGASWQVIATNVPPTNNSYAWNSTISTSSLRGVWKVVSLTDTNIFDQTDGLFALRNTNLYFYVNDSSASGDVYCTAIGSVTNNGLSPGQPLDSVSELLGRWDLEPGDVVFIDTGIYSLSSPILIEQFDSGLRTNNSAYHVRFQGSTNDAAGGTIFTNQSGPGVHISSAPGIDLANITVRGGSAGLKADNSDNCNVQYFRAERAVDGYEIQNCLSFAFLNCLGWANDEKGIDIAGASSHVTWENGLLWSNKYGVYMNSGYLAVENTTIGAFGVSKYAYLYLGGTLTSDYNNIVLREDAFCGIEYPAGVVSGQSNRYENVAFWSKTFGRDTFSLTFDPQFADENGGDFHLKSSNGRFLPGTGWVNDTNPLTASLLIDSGDPNSPYQNEQDLNGGRINIDLYGNTWQATRTPTNGWLSIISLNDGGNVEGANVELRFFAGWIATGHLVTIDYSGDAGVTWLNVATNKAASQPFYIWNSIPYGKSAVSLWRVTSENDSRLSDTSDVFFVLHNGGSIEYYVNDQSTAGDVYTTAPGATNNSGLLPSLPMASVQAVLSRYNLDPVDIIYVDTGEYLTTNAISVDQLDSGTSNAHVIIQGSTNTAAGGTIINRQTKLGDGILLASAVGVDIRNIVVENAASAVHVVNANNCVVDSVQTKQNLTGFDIDGSRNIDFVHCISANDTNGLSSSDSDFEWLGGIIWNDPFLVALQSQSHATFRNSAFSISGYGRRIFRLDNSSSVVNSDYNNLVALNQALIAEQSQPIGGDDLFDFLVDWQKATTQDVHSLTHAPLFVDEVSGNYHLQSKTGRIAPSGGFTNDAVQSPMIDTGDPTSTYANETSPNGARINIGAYGNTADASLSLTNPWVLAISLNDGGTIRGTNNLYWAFGGGLSPTSRIMLQYSENGIEYVNIATNLPVGDTTFAWDSSTLPLIAEATWRLVSQDYTNVLDEVDEPFAIKNQIVTIYVNDQSTVGDVYCTAVGSSTNDGLSAAAPLSDPSDAFKRYPLGAGDTVYIDTGYYQPLDTVRLTDKNRGSLSFPLTIVGSTNWLSGGSVLDAGNSASDCFNIDGSRFVNVSNLKFKNGSVGASIANSLNCRFDWLESYSNANSGIAVDGSLNIHLEHCASWANGSWGLRVSASGCGWDMGVIWSNNPGAVFESSSSLGISNSILHASATGLLYRVAAGLLKADYNFLSRDTNNFLIAYDAVAVRSFPNLKEWQFSQDVDLHSVLLDPLLANAAAGDFHLKSESGRFNAGIFVNDSNTSWAIDAADPAAAYNNEPSPNGSRMNVGLEANTVEASKTYTNAPQLLCATLDDGGTVDGLQLLYWLSRGMSATSQVRLEFSSNSGLTWNVMATDLAASQTGYLWSNTNPPSPIAKWRVVDQANSNVNDTIQSSFILRVGPIRYYVNDTSTVGDVYCTAIGSALNNGLSSNAPMDSIQRVLDVYDLAQGDSIFIDTGDYRLQSEITIGGGDSGVSTNLVMIVGSTNLLAGGTVLEPVVSNFMGSSVIHGFLADGIGFQDLTVRNADAGFRLQSMSDILMLHVISVSNQSAGISLSLVSVQIDRSVVVRNRSHGIDAQGSDLIVLNSIISSNVGSAIQLSQSALTASSSVFQVSGAGRYCYAALTNSHVRGDYNDLVVTNGANYVLVGGLEVEGIPQWTQLSTQEMHSLSVDPLFADSARDDYHLRSTTGRYDPTSGVYVTTDTNFSFLIDTAGPTTSYTNEPAPNGGRRNIGLYGDTTEESKSRTNAWLLAITASAGGRLEGKVNIVWAYDNMPTSDLVRLDYSYDNGVSWTNISTQAVGSLQYSWTSDLKTVVGTQEVWVSSPVARWRIVRNSDTNLSDVTDSHFALRNRPFFYYVNDTSTVCDLWCAGTGSDTNLGLFPFAPKLTLKSLLADLDVEGDDTIYIDTGVYPIYVTNAPVIGSGDSGKSFAHVYVRFSTNFGCGGADFTNASGGALNLLGVNGSYVDVHDMRGVGGDANFVGNDLAFTNGVLTNGSITVQGRNVTIQDSVLRRGNLNLAGTNDAASGLQVLGGSASLSGAGITMQNSVIYSTNAPALTVGGGSSINILNNTLVSSTTAYLQSDPASSVTLANNILVADGTLGDAFCIQWVNGLLNSDYNDLIVRNGAWVGNRNGNWERLMYWLRESGQDGHSLAHDPLFFNEAGLDFHEKSRGGRYSNGVFVVDAVHSPAIDSGSPVYSFANESAPNGSRINIGAYGNSFQAGRSQTSAYVLAVAPNDGGVVKGSSVTLRWMVGGMSTSSTVTLQYSSNGGASWTNIAAGILAVNGQYAWNTTNFPSSLNAAWRVVSDSDTNVFDQSDQPFALRNVPLNFYVNDAAMTGDVYCATNGTAGGDGLTPQTPALSLQSVFGNYDTEGRDVIFVDTGTYNLTSDVRVIWSDGGDTSGMLVVRGSTNLAAGGTVLHRGNRVDGNGFDVNGSYVDLRDLAVRSAFQGVLFDSNRFSVAERMLIYSNEFGVVNRGASSITNRDLRLWDNGQIGIDLVGSRTTFVENCTFVGSGFAGVRIAGSVSNVIQNSIFYMTVTNSSAIREDTNAFAGAFVDYNIYFMAPAATNSTIDGTYTNLLTRQLVMGKDYRSNVTNPLFQNVASGDFHEKSVAGRFQDSLNGFTNDAVNSWAIDHGNPLSLFTNEPQVNGARINIGAYGNTEYAGKGSTNQSVFVRVLNTPTTLSTNDSPLPLLWSVLNAPSGATVRVEYSGDNGLTWTVLAANLPVTQEYFIWSLSPIYNTYGKGLMRVVSEQGYPTMTDSNNAPIDMFFGEFAISTENVFTNNGAIVWRGAWGENYQVQYADYMMSTNRVYAWSNAVNGVGQNQRANFQSTVGGDFQYEDITSTSRPFRIYRVILEQYEP